MPELILSPRATEDGRRLSKAASEMGWTIHQMNKWRVDEDAIFANELAIYGEPLFCRLMAAQIGRVLLEPPHDWLIGLPISITHRKIQYIKYCELSDLKLPLSIKPPDDKIFPASIYDDCSKLLQREDIDKDQPILVSDVVSFEKEFRIHLLDGIAKSGSRYSVKGELDCSGTDDLIPTAKAFAEEAFLASNGSTPPAVVVDVGVTSFNDWAVVEANPCFGSGIYEGNEKEILKVLLRSCCQLGDSDDSLLKFQFPIECE